jgi:hypothetical protein
MIRHKFHAKPTELDGIHFRSKKEAKRYTELKMLHASSEVLFFLRQVPFHLPGNVRYVCDFMVFWVNGEITIEDVKGMKLPLYEAKKKILEATYPIQITEI